MFLLFYLFLITCNGVCLWYIGAGVGICLWYIGAGAECMPLVHSKALNPRANAENSGGRVVVSGTRHGNGQRGSERVFTSTGGHC